MSNNRTPEDPTPDQLDWDFLYENAACGYLSLAPSMEVTRINDTAMTCLGYKREDLSLPVPLKQVMSNELVDLIQARVESTNQGEPVRPVPTSFQGALKGKDGTDFPALFHLSQDLREPGTFHLAAFHLNQHEDLLESLALTNARLREADQAHTWKIRHLDTIAQVIPDAIISIDESQKVIYSNPAAAAMFGMNPDHMIGTPLEHFIPARYRDRHQHDIQKFHQSGVTMREMAGSLTVLGLRSDNTEFPLEASISQVEIDGRPTFTVVLRDVTLRVKAEQELRQTREKLRQLSARMRSVREEEQRHVARELHDDVGQRLSALRMDVAALRESLPADDAKLFDLIENMDELVGTTVQAVRRLATGLRPKILDELGLAPAIETLLNDIQTRFDIKHEFDIDEDIELSEHESIALYRIVQEAMHNIVKHADARNAWVSMRMEPDQCVLTIRDDGRGMQSGDEHKANALGLTGMRERIMEFGGEMLIHSLPNQGTRIECHLPIEQVE